MLLFFNVLRRIEISNVYLRVKSAKDVDVGLGHPELDICGLLGSVNIASPMLAVLKPCSRDGKIEKVISNFLEVTPLEVIHYIILNYQPTNSTA